MHNRLVARTAAGIITSLALLGGPGIVQVAQADTMTAAQHCRAERQDVARAKVRVKKATKALKKAKKAHKPRVAKKAAKKVKKTKRNLKRQRAQMSRWCSKARSEAAVTTQGQETRSGYDGITNSSSTQQLPPSLRTAVLAATASAQSAIDALLAQVPGASPDTLNQLLAQIEALDPSTLQMAVDELAQQLRSAGGDPAVLSALIEGLLGNVTAGSPVDTGGLGDLKATVEALVASLTSFDPSTGAAGLADLETAVDELTDQLAAADPQLATLFGTLAGITGGGTLPTDPTELIELITDGLTGAIGDAGTTTTITDVLGGLLGGLGL